MSDPSDIIGFAVPGGQPVYRQPEPVTAVDDLAAWLDQILKDEAVAAVPRVTIFSGGSPGMTTPRCIADRPLPGADRICQWQLEPATEAPLWWDAAMREHDRAHLDDKGQLALVRIAADRQILALHSEAYRDCRICHQQYPCTTVRLLALPHADRPGYQEAWRPA